MCSLRSIVAKYLSRRGFNCRAGGWRWRKMVRPGHPLCPPSFTEPPSAPKRWPHSLFPCQKFPCHFPRVFLNYYLAVPLKRGNMGRMRRSRACSLTFCSGKRGRENPKMNQPQKNTRSTKKKALFCAFFAFPCGRNSNPLRLALARSSWRRGVFPSTNLSAVVLTKAEALAAADALKSSGAVPLGRQTAIIAEYCGWAPSPGPARQIRTPRVHKCIEPACVHPQNMQVHAGTCRYMQVGA